MPEKSLQNVLLKNLVETIRSSRVRIQDKTDFLDEEAKKMVDEAVWEELKTVVHSFLCEFDGATSLSDYGSVSIFDESGNQFDKFLHELVFDELTNEELE